jgi:uncharacterized protein (TIGR03437 family)
MLTTSNKGLMIRLIAAFLFSISLFAETPGNIQTVAGNGNSAFSGDGGPATKAGINVPVDVYLDSSGNMFITDQFNNRIRKVTPGGTISTVAGNGTAGYAGDGGPAVDAEINTPTGIRGDSAGNLYIADAGNQRIRKVNRSGIISTIAGNGSVGYSGDGGPAVDAGFYNPVRVAILPNGNILVADQSDHRVRLINSSTGIISTFAGNGIGTPETGAFSGDGGRAISASLNNPTAVAVNASGDVYISDQHNQRIRKVSLSGIITTIAGNGSAGYGGDGGPATKATLNYPGGINVDAAGNVYFNDDLNFRTRKITTGGTISTIAGTGVQGFSGDGGPAVDAELNGQFGVSLDLRGNVYIADSMNNRIREIYAKPLPLPTILQTGGLLNGASFQQGIVPGSWITIYGTNLSSKTDNWISSIVNGKLPTSLDNVKVSVGGEPAYISYISSEQIDAVAPNVAAGPVEVKVTNLGGTSAAVTTTAQAFQPAFFEWPGSYAVATTLQYTLAVKNGTFPGLTTTPAKPGEVIVLWGTGFGPTSPSAPVGIEAPSSPTYYTANAVTVTVGGKTATVYSAVLAPGFAGLYQVAIQIPASLTNGDYPVVAAISGAQSPQTILITVQE